MSNVLKSKLSYASLGKSRPVKVCDKAVFNQRQNDCIYDSILSGMNGTEKDYISNLIMARRGKDTASVSNLLGHDEASRTKTATQSPKFNSPTTTPQMSPKLRHIQSSGGATFPHQKIMSTSTSLKGSTVLMSHPNSRREEGENFIGSLDGYINRLQNTQTPNTKSIEQSSNQEYKRKYKHLAQEYMDLVNTSKSKEDRLVQCIRKLQGHIHNLESKVGQDEQRQKDFLALWKRREDQFGILLGIEQQINQQVCSGGSNNLGGQQLSDLELESFESTDWYQAPQKPKLYPGQEVKRKSRHTVNYY